MADLNNPYAAPKGATASNVEHRDRKLLIIGTEERHEVAVQASLWSGLEAYFVDGQKQLETNTWWGVRRFVVGETERHEVEFHVGLNWRVRVVVDGCTVDDDLFVEKRRTLALLIFGLLSGVAGLPLVVSLRAAWW